MKYQPQLTQNSFSRLHLISRYFMWKRGYIIQIYFTPHLHFIWGEFQPALKTYITDSEHACRFIPWLLAKSVYLYCIVSWQQYSDCFPVRRDGHRCGDSVEWDSCVPGEHVIRKQCSDWLNFNSWWDSSVLIGWILTRVEIAVFLLVEC